MEITAGTAKLIDRALRLAIINSKELASMAESAGDTDEAINYKGQVIAFRQILLLIGRGDNDDRLP